MKCRCRCRCRILYTALSRSIPQPPLNDWGPLGVCGVGWGVPWGVLSAVAGTPTYLPQNDPPVVPIILNTMCEFFEQIIPPPWGGGGSGPAARKD